MAGCIIRVGIAQLGRFAKWQPRRQIMEKQEFEQLVNLLKEVNKHLEHVSSCLDRIDNSLEKIRGETKKRRGSPFDI